MQIVTIGDNLHEMSNLFSEKNISICHLLKILPRVLRGEGGGVGWASGVW